MSRFINILCPKFRRPQIIKLGRLLNMEYRPSEIAKELDINVSVIYQNYIPAGCPHRRDKQGSIWVSGIAFHAWVLEIHKRNKEKKFILGEEEAWCMKCNKVVIIENPQIRKTKNHLLLKHGNCNICGSKVNRLMRSND